MMTPEGSCMPSTAIVWFRRDLRVHDHPALTAALEAADVVVPLFVLDEPLLHGRMPSANRTWFMRESVAALAGALAERGAPLRIASGRPADVVPALARELSAGEVYVTRDAAPYGRRRDRAVADRLAADGIAFRPKRGLYVHEPDEVRKADGGPFTVYSPYRRAWQALDRRPVLPAPDRIPGPNGAAGRGSRSDLVPEVSPPTADRALIPAPGEDAARGRLARWLDGPIDAYASSRNRFDRDGSSRLSQDLRWGLLSPNEVVARADGAGEGRRVFVQELAWREFYAHVLWHHPRVLREPFQPAFADLAWADDDDGFRAWAEGRTGYPIVDAAMRQLRASGFVHNRARMIAASFLTKDLLLDWRLGEAEFMRHLTDGDVASNNGGWQWTASTGTDPQPYFRIFNPVLQAKRFDPDGGYVRRWVPELAGVPTTRIHEPWAMTAAEQAQARCRIGTDYPAPIVEHAAARERALAAFAAAKERAG
jgi:deoxyribodipyrimidine photo-lyase